MTLCSDLISRASTQLEDTGNADWSSTELLDYLNEGRARLAELQPSLFSAPITITLVAGVKQGLTADVLTLLEPLEQADSSGSTARVPTRFVKSILDRYQPGWQSTASGVTRQYAYDPRDPYVFWVYPPAVAGAKLTFDAVSSPAALLVTDTLDVPTATEGILLDYMLARAYGKNAIYAGPDGVADKHWQRFMEAAGGRANGSSK